MNLPRVIFPGLLALAGGQLAGAANEPASLAAVVNADAPFVIHVRDMPELIENWSYTPLARMWREPDVQRFFAPALARFSGDAATGFIAELKAETGLSPREALDLFPGEVMFALLAIPDRADGPDVVPRFALGAEVGENRATIEALFEQARAQDENTIVTEEFQGETIYIVLEADTEGEEQEPLAWAFVDDVLWIANPKDALQELIANSKRGGASSPVTAAPGFAAVYRENPNAHVAVYLNLEAVIREVSAQMNVPTTPDGSPRGPLTRFGISNADAVRALGLDALRGLYLATTIEPAASTWTVGFKWSEQRGLLKLLAYGDPPAPLPAFTSGTWYNATASRFSIPDAFAALQEVIADLNPAFGATMDQQIAGINDSLGIDIERDFFGSFGGEILQAADIREAPPGSPGPFIAHQLLAFSLSNPEALRHAVDALRGMLPPSMAQMITPREYLGETINTIVPPGGNGENSFSYAIARNQLMIGIGSPALLETAIQSFGGTGGSLWDKPEVAAALAEFPSGSSAVSYSDIRRAVAMGFNALAMIARASAVPLEEGTAQPPGWLDWIDPDAVPPAAVVEKYWSTAAGAVYRESDGLRSIGRIQHVP